MKMEVKGGGLNPMEERYQGGRGLNESVALMSMMMMMNIIQY
jgi:hypothetical protein